MSEKQLVIRPTLLSTSIAAFMGTAIATTLIAGAQAQEVQDEVNAAKAQVISGELHPFTGPIADNTGEQRVAEGETMSDEALLSFDWLVEGVVGEIPQ